MVESKFIDDLWTSLVVNKQDFGEKMKALITYERKYLLVIGLESEVLSWREHREIHPNIIRYALAGLLGKLGLPVHFAENTSMAERWMLDWFVKYFKLKRGI
jgi:ERCC4-type nuclease